MKPTLPASLNVIPTPPTVHLDPEGHGGMRSCNVRMKYSTIMRSWGDLYPASALSCCLVLMQHKTLTYWPLHPTPPSFTPSLPLPSNFINRKKGHANAQTNKTAEESCNSCVDVLLATLADRYGPQVPRRLIYTANICSTSASLHLSLRRCSIRGRRWVMRGCGALQQKTTNGAADEDVCTEASCTQTPHQKIF